MKGKRLQRCLKSLDTSTILPQSKKPIPPTVSTEPLATLEYAKKDSTETASTASLSVTLTQRTWTPQRL